MDENTFNKEDYESTLKWLVENRHNSSWFVRSEQRLKDNKWWFLFKRNNLSQDEFRQKLTTLLRKGFNVPDFNEEKDVHLISERNESIVKKSKIFTCSNPDCNHILDISSDVEKSIAIKHYHNVKFGNEPANTIS